MSLPERLLSNRTGIGYQKGIATNYNNKLTYLDTLFSSTESMPVSLDDYKAELLEEIRQVPGYRDYLEEKIKAHKERHLSELNVTQSVDRLMNEKAQELEELVTELRSLGSVESVDDLNYNRALDLTARILGKIKPADAQNIHDKYEKLKRAFQTYLTK